jgi:hypothetical protein
MVMTPRIVTIDPGWPVRVTTGSVTLVAAAMVPATDTADDPDGNEFSVAG